MYLRRTDRVFAHLTLEGVPIDADVRVRLGTGEWFAPEVVGDERRFLVRGPDWSGEDGDTSGALITESVVQVVARVFDNPEQITVPVGEVRLY